jgi:hypothetical protein
MSESQGPSVTKFHATVYQVLLHIDVKERKKKKKIWVHSPHWENNKSDFDMETASPSPVHKTRNKTED